MKLNNDYKEQLSLISPIKKWLACSVQSSSYGCTREVTKHEGSVKSHEEIAECNSKLLDCLPPKHIHTQCLHANHFFYNFETFKYLLFPVEKRKTNRRQRATYEQMDRAYQPIRAHAFENLCYKIPGVRTPIALHCGCFIF